MRIRTYTELVKLDSLEERFEYLALNGTVADTTFGVDRWVNQKFYHSREWRIIRDHIIARDIGFDLAVFDVPIRGNATIHHMNPIAVDDIVDNTEFLMNPEYLVCVSHSTHNAIHYGDKRQLPRPFVERSPGDTALWRS